MSHKTKFKDLKFENDNGQLKAVDSATGHELTPSEVDTLNDRLGKRLVLQFALSAVLAVVVPLGFMFYDKAQDKKTNK